MAASLNMSRDSSTDLRMTREDQRAAFFNAVGVRADVGARWQEAGLTSDDPSTVIFEGPLVDGEELAFARFLDIPAESGRSLAAKLATAAAASDSIELQINSPGGDILQIGTVREEMLALGRKGAKISTYVRGEASSAASFIALSGNDGVRMSEFGQAILHRPQAALFGANADQLRAFAGALDEFEMTAAGIYDQRMNYSSLDGVETGLDVMGANGGLGTILSAREAVETGFADEVVGAPSAESDNDDSARMHARARLQVMQLRQVAAKNKRG